MLTFVLPPLVLALQRVTDGVAHALRVRPVDGLEGSLVQVIHVQRSGEYGDVPGELILQAYAFVPVRVVTPHQDVARVCGEAAHAEVAPLLGVRDLDAPQQFRPGLFHQVEHLALALLQ